MTEPEGWYYVRNWHRFQHYGKRSPPWIKLHAELLQSLDWVGWSNESRALAIACLLIASKHAGKCPKSARTLQKLASFLRKPDLQPLVKSGFLSESASTMLATVEEVEVESEKKEPSLTLSDSSRRERVHRVVRQTASSLNGEALSKTQVKALWEQRISTWICQNHDTERAYTIITAYQNGEKWAKSEFNRIDAQLKNAG